MITELYQALIALIIANFSADYPLINSAKFSGYPIFQGYQNDYPIPNNGKYVILTTRPEENQILNPNSITAPLDNTQRYLTLLSSSMQIDFYGENAETNARNFQLLMNSQYANKFFSDNSYSCTVNRVNDVLNLSDVLGRDMYIPRFMVMCSLFNNPTIETPLVTFDGFVDNIRLAEIQ